MYLGISSTNAAPLQLHFLQPYQRVVMQQQQQNIQQQLLELQAMQQLSSMSASTTLNNPIPPLLFFLPEHQMEPNTNINEKQIIKGNIDNEIKLKQHTKSKDEDLDSVVIDAEPVPIIEEQKAFLVLPNGRFSIGGIISAIPFLPIEINVPDTISWAYNGIANGISSIISIIGQRPPINSGTEVVSLKSMINNLKMRREQENVARPIIIMPIENFKTPILPVQL
ncbi:unnamed protein product [Euphydryas editha]|nr:unnamed protein product [Euphydryas editha]